MLDKERLVAHIQEEGLKGTVLKALDKVEIVLKKHEIKATDFLTPYEVRAVCDVLDPIYDINYIASGGYEEAERKLITIFPDYLDEGVVEIPIGAFEIRSTSQFEKLNHRDYLGAILTMGLKREKIGDLIVHNGICQVIMSSSLKDYIFYNLDKVGNTSVKVKALELEDIRPPEITYKEMIGNVASLRLDSVVSLAFKISRSEAQDLITKEKVSVNWASAARVSYEVKEADVISVRGKGRVIVASIEGRTKSERIIVKLQKPV